MNCPYCDNELLYHDYYGKGWTHNFEKGGDIYKCQNEECESGVFNNRFYTDKKGNLHEGLSC